MEMQDFEANFLWKFSILMQVFYGNSLFCGRLSIKTLNFRNNPENSCTKSHE